MMAQVSSAGALQWATQAGPGLAGQSILRQVYMEMYMDVYGKSERSRSREFTQAKAEELSWLHPNSKATSVKKAMLYKMSYLGEVIWLLAAIEEEEFGEQK